MKTGPKHLMNTKERPLTHSPEIYIVLILLQPSRLLLQLRLDHVEHHLLLALVVLLRGQLLSLEFALDRLLKRKD